MSSAKFFERWDWEDAWAAFFMAVATIVVVSLAIFIWHDHKPRYYYLQSPAHTGTCVVADIDWGTDETMYCSDDVRKALDVMDRLNGSLRVH